MASSWIFLDAAAQSTVALAMTSGQTTAVLASSAAFGNPTGGQQTPLIILDAGNGSWNPLNPLATPYEYVYETGNVPGTNTITFVRAQGNTTAKAFSAGAIVAAVPLAEMFADDGTGAFARVDRLVYQPNLAQVPIKIAEVLSPAGTWTINPLPTGFRHLVVEWYARGDTAATSVSLSMRFNNISTGTYDTLYMQALGTVETAPGTLTATAAALGDIPAASATANYFGIGRAQINYYTSAVGNKLVLSNAVMSYADTVASMFNEVIQTKWRTTATPITRLDIFAASGALVAGSLLTLYGIP